MEKKVKTIIIVTLIIVISITFGSGITYSMFHSRVNGVMNDQKVATFIFNAQALDEISLPLIDLKPGEEQVYDFSVSNVRDEWRSDVTIEYRLTIKTYHIVPLLIELYDGNDDLLLTCDETYTRGENNELICNTDDILMDHNNDLTNEYSLKVEFPMEYNDAIYAGLVDYINIEIKSWQKMDG